MTALTTVLRAIGWPFRMLLLGVIVGYQRFISPLFGPSCRMYPCCSEYGRQAIIRHGAAKGTVLTAARLVRCNPWHKGGIDEVPERGEWRSPVDPDGRPRRSGDLDAGSAAGQQVGEVADGVPRHGNPPS